MILIDFAFDPAFPNAKLNVAKADETMLRCYCFHGDQILIIDGADFSARWGWVTLLDFAAVLVYVCKALRCETSATLDFTESEAELKFDRLGDQVSISATYTTATATITLNQLSSAAYEYASRILKAAIEVEPALAKNRQLKTWYPMAGEPLD